MSADTRPAPIGAGLLALMFALPFAAFLLRLGGAPLFDVDEGAFSEATREMFDRGDFLFTYLNDSPRFDKPILIYWLQAISVALLGVNEWAFRLPSALAGIGWAWAVWQFARPRFGPQTAVVALAVTATSLGPMLIGRAATADALLNLLLALTLFDLWRHFELPAEREANQAPLRRAFVWMALGFLAKGPVAVVVPAAVTLLYCASRRDWRRWLRAMLYVPGQLRFSVIALPWYAYALLLHGGDFIEGFVMRHNVQRFTGTLEGHAGSLFYYVVVVPLLVLPWSGPLLASLRQVRADGATSLRRFLWIWAGFVVVFFSMSGTKLPHYGLYGATPLFLLIATHRDEVRRMGWHALMPTLFLAMLVSMPLIMHALSQGNGDAFYRAQLARALGEAGPAYYAITGGALACWLAVARLGRLPVWQRLMLGATAQVLALTLAVNPFIGAVLQQPVKDAGLKAAELGLPAVTWRFSTAPSFSVYRGAPTPAHEPEVGELVLTRAGRPLEIEDAEFETVLERGGVLLLRRVR